MAVIGFGQQTFVILPIEAPVIFGFRFVLELDGGLSEGLAEAITPGLEFGELPFPG